MTRRTRGVAGLVCALALILGACGGEADTGSAGDTLGGEPDTPEGRAATPTPAEPGGTIRVYASVTQDTVDAVIEAYTAQHPDVDVELFRAPTGEINARLAAERRDGDVRADVLWLTDPLSIQQYDAERMLRTWTPEGIEVVPEEFREATFFGTRILNMVLVHQDGLDPALSSWQDLADLEAEEPVAIPDPGFAGSAFGALGYFALSDDFGLDYYRALEERGLIQVQSPGEVVTGVAEGRFAAGMTLDKAARAAAEKGSPLDFVFADPGAIAIYSPIAVVDTSDNAATAQSFAAFTITAEAQQAVADTGWQPIRDDVEWPHPTTPTVTVDWDAAFDRQDELLEEYRAIVGG